MGNNDLAIDVRLNYNPFVKYFYEEAIL